MSTGKTVWVVWGVGVFAYIVFGAASPVVRSRRPQCCGSVLRVALLVQFPVWILAVIGVLLTRRKTRRVLAAEGIHPRHA